jgi:Xaa-Pro aminopeptidase
MSQVALSVNHLREIIRQKNIKGYILSPKDAFQNEFVPDRSNKLKSITNFSGSNGLLVLLEDHGLFFTDGRYLEQALKELDQNIFTIFDISLLKNFSWDRYLTQRDAIGFDPLLFTQQSMKIFRNLQTIPVSLDVWENSKYQSRIFIYPWEHAGQPAHKKIEQLKARLGDNQNYLLTDTSFICWLLNLRSKEDDCIGMFDCYLIVSRGTIDLFADIELSNDIAEYLSNLNIKLCNSSYILRYLQDRRYESFLIDENTCSVAFSQILTNVKHDNFYKIWQACKSLKEIGSFQQAHINDGVVLCELFAWLETMPQTLENSSQELLEFDLTDKLIDLRKRSIDYIKESFPAICGYQENSSIIHYRAKKDTSKKIQGSGVLLIDTGGHYYGGTTDVTRTLFIGNSNAKPDAKVKHFYNLVLKGHINLAAIKFKKGCSGQNLDILARMHLWQRCTDYPHSTGHGVGNFLNVHEGPQNINLSNNIELKPGMVLSNEPGYYEQGKFGIRIENLMYVKNSTTDDFLEFDTLTLAPFDARLMDPSSLNQEQYNWLSRYYAKLHDILMPRLSDNAKQWLKKQLCVINF